MVALKAGAVESFLKRPDPAAICLLVYGPDVGLVHERARHLARMGLENPNDPFTLIRLDGDTIAADPARLADEATTMAMFGGARSIWVRLGSRSIAPAVEAVLTGPEPTARIVIEAGDLKRNAPIVALCERNPRAVTLPCYADGAAEIGQLIDRTLSESNIAITPQARSYLAGLLGGDRIATRNELEKLRLYAQDGGQLDVADIEALIADTNAGMLDEIVDLTFSGDTGNLETALTTLLASGMNAGVPLLMALRQAQSLHQARLEIDRGMPASQAVEKIWPRLHFRRKPLIQKAVSIWSTIRIEAAIERLAAAVLENRKAGAFGGTIALRTFAALAAEVRRSR